jgi:hypothetical protein
MTDATQGGDQPTEEEIRAYLGQIREADPAAIVVQAYQMLGEGAQIKLGRSDARVLIDAMAGIAEAVGDRLPAELVGQMKQGVAQLQAAQVQEENRGGPGQQGPAGQPGGGQAPGDQAPQPEGQAPQSEGGGEKLTDRLWVPGKGPTPGM